MSRSADATAASSMEVSEWENINKILKHHGCGAVHVSPRGDLSEGIVLDLPTSQALRTSITSLVQDTERRQNLIHGLIQSNNRLKDDVRGQRGRADDLQNILDGVKAKICDLEDDFICKTHQQPGEEKLRAQEEKLRAQEEKLRAQAQSIAQLRMRVSQAAAVEDRRRRTFLRLVKRQPQEHNHLDQQILDVIAGYERQVKRLQDEIRQCESLQDPVREKSLSGGSPDLDTTPNYRALLKSYQEQLCEARRKEEQLLRENGGLREEMEARPSARELALYKKQMKRMETLLRCRGVTEKSEEEAEPKSATQREPLPDGECHRHLQGPPAAPPVLQALVSHFQKLFDVPSVSGVYPRMSEVYSKLGEMCNAMRSLRGLLGLDDTAGAGVVVHAVGRLRQEAAEGSGHRLQQILGTLDIDSIVNKIQEHEEFFPAFEELIKDLLDVLDIHHLEEILPEVQRLKHLEAQRPLGR